MKNSKSNMFVIRKKFKDAKTNYCEFNDANLYVIKWQQWRHKTMMKWML